MQSAFHCLRTTLQKEGVAGTSIPTQFFCHSLADFASQFSHWRNGSGLTNEPVLVFIDGIRKTLAHSDKTVDDEFCVALAALSPEFVNVTNLLCVNELHASAELMDKLCEFFRDRKKSTCVVLGSGTVTDLIKHALFLEKKDWPLVCVPTALTVTAFTSSFSVLDFSGAKRTQISRSIDATFWVSDVVRGAPIAYSRAGYGDLLARFVAYADWYLSHFIGVAARYDELAFRLMEPFAEPIKKAAPAFGGALFSQEHVEEMCAALAMAGIAMSVSGETTPLSGYEHTISHALDFLRLSSHRTLVLHGEQVALACLTSAVTIDSLLQSEALQTTNLSQLDPPQAKKLISRLVHSAPFYPGGDGSISDEQKNAATETFYKDYVKKLERWNTCRNDFQRKIEEGWSEARAQIRRLSIPACEMEGLLRQSKLPLCPEETAPPTSALEYRWAVRFSPFVRTRMSIGDLVFWLGEDPVTLAAL